MYSLTTKKKIEMSWKKDFHNDESQACGTQATQQSQPAIVDTKSLSGGERSYTTLCLLLAMGKNVNCPFRVMDEFDVFMDAQNRKIAMTQMLNAAEADKNTKQFIFITPHDISAVPDKPTVRKQAMKPPEEDFGRARQSVLDPHLR